MSFKIEPHDQETAVVTVGKTLDFRNAEAFKTACQEHVDAGKHNFILDFTDTGILDSTGLGSIFSLYRKVSPLNGQVVFASISRPVQVVVQLTRTYKVFRQFPTVEDALEALQQGIPSHR
ncbi:MAG: STAS domain-containing protein [Rhodothermales bacterium]|jgi:anti-sigma B factor antagonist